MDKKAFYKTFLYKIDLFLLITADRLIMSDCAGESCKGVNVTIVCCLGGLHHCCKAVRHADLQVIVL